MRALRALVRGVTLGAVAVVAYLATERALQPRPSLLRLRLDAGAWRFIPVTA